MKDTHFEIFDVSSAKSPYFKPRPKPASSEGELVRPSVRPSSSSQEARSSQGDTTSPVQGSRSRGSAVASDATEGRALSCQYEAALKVKEVTTGAGLGDNDTRRVSFLFQGDKALLKTDDSVPGASRGA